VVRCLEDVFRPSQCRQVPRTCGRHGWCLPSLGQVLFKDPHGSGFITAGELFERFLAAFLALCEIACRLLEAAQHALPLFLREWARSDTPNPDRLEIFHRDLDKFLVAGALAIETLDLSL